MTELYDILEISKNAKQDDIKKAYRKKALENHPDKGGSEENFKKINFAYSILSDLKKKERYDLNGSTDHSDNNIPQDFFDNIVKDLFSEFKFSNFFNIGTNFKNKNKPLFYELKVTLEDLCKRNVKNILINRNRRCDCIKNCKICNNTLYIQKVINIGNNLFQKILTDCDNCKQNINKCTICKNGIKSGSKVFDIYLTPEIYNGYKYILENEGDETLNSYIGDLIIVIIYENHKIFTFKNDNLLMVHNLSLKEALCGHEHNIQHPNGDILHVKIDEITKPHTLRLVTGKGLNSKGHIEITYNIIFPEKLTDEEILKISTILP